MPKDHERLAYRLVHILMKLHQGELLHPAVLAQEFKVNIRTIQRDLNERFSFLPLVNEAGSYRLESPMLVKLVHHNTAVLDNLVGIYGLYPIMPHEVAQQMFDEHPSAFNKTTRHKHEVTLKIYPEIASFFKQRPLLPFQRVVEEFSDGTLIVQSHVESEEQIIPLVQYWLPHIRIISSSEWQQHLEQRLKTYCKVIAND